MLVVCLLVLVTATASDTDNDIVDIGEEPVTEELVWFTDRQAAEKQANEDGKSLMYLITEDWCGKYPAYVFVTDWMIVHFSIGMLQKCASA